MYVWTETGNKIAKFHVNTLSPSENIAKSFRVEATFLSRTVHDQLGAQSNGAPGVTALPVVAESGSSISVDEARCSAPGRASLQ